MLRFRQAVVGMILFIFLLGLSACNSSPWKMEIALKTFAVGEEVELRVLYNKEQVIDEQLIITLSDESLAKITTSANRIFVLAKEAGNLEIKGQYNGKEIGKISVVIKESNFQIVGDYLSAHGNSVEVKLDNKKNQQFIISVIERELVIDFTNHFEDDASYDSEMRWNISSGEGIANYVFTSPEDYECNILFSAFISDNLDFIVDDIQVISGSSEDLFDLVNSYSCGDAETAMQYYESFLYSIKK